LVRFVVLKSYTTYSVCLRISTYSGQATTKAGVVAEHHAAIVPVGGSITPHKNGEIMDRKIELVVENSSITIDSMSRVNFAKPYTVEHNVKVRNVGRLVGESVGRLDDYLATSLGYSKS